MTEEKLKENFAQRLAYYRRISGMTQLDLAEKLNYSDKSVSKWERGDGLPDLFVITQIAELFGVTVNDLIAEGIPRRPLLTRNKLLTTLMALGLPWLAATVLMSVFGMFLPDFPSWIFFVCAVPVTAIVAIVFTCIWWSKFTQFLSVSALIWTVPTAIVAIVPVERTALLFIVAAVLQALTVLWYLRKK